MQFIRSKVSSFSQQHWSVKVGVGAAVSVGVVLLCRKWSAGGTCRYRRDLDGRVVIITGGNTGIGLETAKELASLNATIIVASRNEAKGEGAVEEIIKYSGNEEVEFMQLDLASLNSVRNFCEEFRSKKLKCDILVNNAGVMMTPYSTTKEGFELQTGVNHLGHFLLCTELMDILEKSGTRVVNISSLYHKKAKTMDLDYFHCAKENYSGREAYAQSKLANILFTKELQTRFNARGSEATAYAVHPGVVRTGLYQHAVGPIANCIISIPWRIFAKSPLEGAQTQLHCCLAPLDKLHPGGYYVDCKLQNSSTVSCDTELARELWDVSEQLVGAE